MTTDIPADVRLDEVLAALNAQMEHGAERDAQVAHLTDQLNRVCGELDRLHIWIESTIGVDAQLGDTPVDHAMRVISSQRSTIERLTSDGDHIAYALRDEAEEREWCDEYEAFVRRVNVGLQEMALLECRRKQQIELRVFVTVVCTDDDVEEQRQRLRGDVFALVNGDVDVKSVSVSIE